MSVVLACSGGIRKCCLPPLFHENLRTLRVLWLSVGARRGLDSCGKWFLAARSAWGGVNFVRIKKCLLLLKGRLFSNFAVSRLESCVVWLSCGGVAEVRV